MPVITAQTINTSVRYRRHALALALMALSPWVCANAEDEPQQALPNQVQALPEPKMAEQAQAGFLLEAVEFVGVTGVSEDELQQTVAERIGKQVSMQDLQEMAAQATAVYHKHGFAMVQVFVPVQEVVGGRVKMNVVEGQLGDVSIAVADNAPVDADRIAKTLAVLEPGKPLNNKTYERAMLLLSDLPGIKPQSAISVGSTSGVTDLKVQVDARDRFQYGLELDNYGTRDSGRHRLTGSMRWASPFERGDNLDLRMMAAQGMHTAFGRLSYEAPLGYRGLRIGGGLARVQYELGGAFALLEPTGTGDVVDLSFSYPLVRQRAMNVFLRGGLDQKSLEDRFDAVNYETKKRIRGASLGIALERRDRFAGGGYSSLNAQLYHGNLNLRDAMSQAGDRPPAGYGTAGSFNKYTLQLARLQYVRPNFNVFLSAGIQRASKNLDAYEKLSLGGPKAVRAYATGEVLVDDGWLTSVEARYTLHRDVSLFAFYDAAGGDMFHKVRPGDGDLSRHLRGYGLGMNWGKPGKASMNLSIAWRGTGPGLADGGNRNPRVFWSIQKAF